MKFASRWTWARWFGDRLADAVAGPDERVVVCPVPMPWVRRVGRGYNQARLIASAMAKGRGWPVAPLLHRTRYSPAQTSVPVAQRKANVTGAFGLAKADLSGWDVWLVDDVKTTGSTLAACTRLLRRAGARRVRVAVAAVADPHGGGFQHL